MMSFDAQLIRSEHLERRRRLIERGANVSAGHGHGRGRRSTRAPRSAPYRLDGIGLGGTGRD